eukprot:CAMPEP_0177622592 /NCGR_PEP_ID=MMETSP0419_2-20121207/28358_1 /TAXON_ID=582737 /ORGANISM="Tetraselmis sp., Strain GSL018" /LENGTH=90 /DNA_ID=CAMNT_0019122901 /DNA_START=766 /DNA_END=1035 /DNA_ORIENTATION=+
MGGHSPRQPPEAMRLRFLGCPALGPQQRHTHREAYDVAVARAVAEMRLLNELCLPLVRIGGLLVAAKGPDPSEELQAAGRSLSELRGELK